MRKTRLYSSSDIFLSCIEGKYYSDEVIFPKNTLIRKVSGEMKVIQTGHTYLLRAGDTFLFPRNQLAKVIKYPLNEQPFRSIAIFLASELLQKYYISHEIVPEQHPVPAIKIFGEHPLFESLFGSLLPYFKIAEELPAEITDVKIEEAITILRFIDKGMDGILAHFDEPGKIDLEDFMEKNYMFNMPLEKFGYLTGRSLKTFQRDFKKIFDTTPQKWLTKKRLIAAHYQIFEKKRKSSEIYFEMGFENLSHFSFAFKREFGYNPTHSGITNH